LVASPGTGGAITTARRQSGSLLAGSVVNGLAAYGFVALGTRSLGAEAFAPVGVLWTFWALSAATLTFPIQHWAIRTIALEGGVGALRAGTARLAGWVAGVAVVQVAIAAALTERLFGDHSWFWPAAVALLALGSAYLGLLRGVLAGTGRYHAAAVVIGGENLIRVAAGLVAVAVSDEALPLAAALLAGPLIGLLWPGAHRVPPKIEGGTAVALVGYTGLSLLAAQVVLNGAPIVLPLVGGSEQEITVVFTTLALLRAPYLMALALTVRATAPLTRLLTGGEVARARHLVDGVLAASLAAAVAAGALAAPLGPPLVAVLFGEGARPEAATAGWLAAGAVLALGGLALTVVLIAAGSGRPLLAAWLCGLAAAGVAVAVPAAPVSRVVAGFVTGETVALGAMWAAARRSLRRAKQ
jgi:hypothetical protein